MKYSYKDIITPIDLLTGKVKLEDVIGKIGWVFNEVPEDVEEFVKGHYASHITDIGYRSYPFMCNMGSFRYFVPEKEDISKEVKEGKSELHVGDKVFISKILRDWDLWCDEMDQTFETVGTIRGIDIDGLYEVEFSGLSETFLYPRECLRKTPEYRKVKKFIYIPYEGIYPPTY